MSAEANLTLGHMIAAHLVMRFRDGRDKSGIPFDDLVIEINDQLTDHLRRAMRRFGTTVERSLAWAIAPLVETGEARWDSNSRRVWISPIGVQLLAAEADYTICSTVASTGQQPVEKKGERQPLVRRIFPNFLRG
jgi:hypothetical protein